MADAFYVPDGAGFVSTELTRGPWDESSQHAGPPAALLARELERCGEPDGRRVGRVTIDILGPVPIAPVTATARVVRPGHGVELVEGELAGPDGEVLRARAWRLRADGVDLPPGLPAHPPPAGPEAGRPTVRFPSDAAVGWHTAMEIRFVAGDYLEPGPATTWFRPRHPLVAGEEPSPLARVMLAADAGNGVSATLDWSRYLFVNVDLSVHLARLPRGEWVCLDAATFPEPDGIGLAQSALYDEHGRIGLAGQTLVIRPRAA
jgi:Acyl-CoA thioesterase C-terminal domain/Acyl-CoA thioesterase N-terminal domain